MRRLIVLFISALLLGLFFADHADARAGFGGGGFRGGGFGGGGFRGGFAGGGFRGGFAGGGFRAAAIGGGFRGGFAGPARWGGVGIGRPGWGVAGIGRPGWVRPGLGWRGRWPYWGAAAGLGLAGAAYYGSSYPYGYGYYDDCPMIRRTVWDGYGYRIVWVNACGYY